MIVIGIDPGVTTGYAEWSTPGQCFRRLGSMTILEAMRTVEVLACSNQKDYLFVIFEDARKRKWYGRMDKEQREHGAGVREGVGSVKRDCAIWEEFLHGLGVGFEARYPHSTKMKAEPFARLTAWEGRTNEHSRDAGMIVFGMNASIARAKLVAFKDAQTAGHRQTAGRGGARAGA